MNRADILTTASGIVSKNRQSSDAAPEDSFGNIAALWSAHLDRPISSADVAVMMGLVKIARIKTNPAHPDNWIDLAGYAACGGEIAMKGKAE